jgi:ubiquinone/menaquinone biosynthesis C-methylase UbiE
MENQEQVWDNISEKWSKFRTKISPSVEKFLSDINGKLLDIGCGSGRNFVKSKKIKWVGIDFSSKMLKFAEKRAKELGIKVQLKKACSNKLPFKDNFFDAVLCYSLIHCINSKKERKETIKEIYRVLKPSGTVLISSWGEKSPRLKNKGKECFIPWTIGENKAKRYTYVFSLKELEKTAKDSGFKIVRAWEERNVNLIAKK